MEEDNRLLESLKRRSLLQIATAAGGVGMLSPSVAAAPGQNNNGSNSGSITQLGDFETGLNGWTTNGGNKLRQSSSNEFPAGIDSGERALVTEVNGDLFPMIENKKRVKKADFSNNPYLRMHVLAQANDTDSDLSFQFRLHHTPVNGGKKKGRKKKRGDTPGSKDVNVKESDIKTVPQLRSKVVQWDMTDLSTEILEAATRLEIVWYLEEHEPDRGHRGRAKGEFDYDGIVIFDDIRLSDTIPVTESQQSHEKKRDLHSEHGSIADRVLEEQREGYERGTYVYSDGTEVPYEFELLSEGYRYVIDGESFEIGGSE